MVDAKDNIKINSDETRAALEYPKQADGGDSAGRLRLGRCRQQPLAHLRQGLGHHESAKRLGGRQARQPESGGEVLDPSDAARPEGPLRRAAAAVLRLVELLQEQGGGEGSAALTSRRSRRSHKLVEASFGYDLPSFKSMYDLDTWKTVGPPVGTVYGYPPRGDEQTSIAGAPARSEVGAQIYNQAINTVMVAKFTQGKEKLDDVIKWAENELQGTLARLKTDHSGGAADARMPEWRIDLTISHERLTRRGQRESMADTVQTWLARTADHEPRHRSQKTGLRLFLRRRSTVAFLMCLPLILIIGVRWSSIPRSIRSICRR